MLYADYKKKDILTVGKGPTVGLDNTAMTAEAEYFINFSVQKKEFSLSLHFSGKNSFLFVNGVKICQFRAKDSELNAYPLRLTNISKEFTVDNMKKWDYTDICMIFQYDNIYVDDSLDIHKYLMKKHDIK